MAYVAFSRIYGGRRVRFFSAKPDTALLVDLARHVDDTTVRPILDEVFPLTRIADAHRAFEDRRRRGKQVVSFDRHEHRT